MVASRNGVSQGSTTAADNSISLLDDGLACTASESPVRCSLIWKCRNEAHALVTSLVHRGPGLRVSRARGRRGRLSRDRQSKQGERDRAAAGLFHVDRSYRFQTQGASSSRVFKAMNITATKKTRRSQRLLTRLAKTAPSNPPAKAATLKIRPSRQSTSPS